MKLFIECVGGSGKTMTKKDEKELESLDLVYYF